MTHEETNDDILFSDAAANWLTSISPQIKDSSRIKYQNLLENYILPEFGNHCFMSISYERLNHFMNDLLLTGGKHKAGLSAKTVSDILCVIRSIFQYMENRGFVPLCNARSITVKHQKSDLRVLSHYEQEKLTNFLYTHMNERNLGILLCMFTGIRLGEVCCLRWEDIVVEEKMIHICHTMQRIQTGRPCERKTKIIITSPKSNCSVRKIPLPDSLVCLLVKYRQHPADYVLTGVSDKYVEPRTLQNHFRRVTQACGIENVHFHTLRHTFATRCVELGFDVKSLSEILGHSNVNITMNRYVHPSMEHKREHMNRLSDVIANACTQDR